MDLWTELDIICVDMTWTVYWTGEVESQKWYW